MNYIKGTSMKQNNLRVQSAGKLPVIILFLKKASDGLVLSDRMT